MSEQQATFLDSGLSPRLGPDDADTTERRAAIYARTSSTSQRFGYSIDEQVRQCSDRCRMLDWTIAFVYKDEAVSGKDTDRPMFQEMLSKAELGLMDVLVFWKLDRFSRSIMHVVQLEKQFSDWGVALHSVTEQLDTSTPAGQFNFRNIANAAEFERDLIKQRTKMGHVARAMQHKWPNNSPPFGYEILHSGKLAIHGGEAPLVRTIFEMYIDLMSMPDVAQSLNERGKTHRGNEWTTSSIQSVLQNTIYSGEYTIGEFEEEVEEYRILCEGLFDQVTAIRHRFRGDAACARKHMPEKRKQRRVGRILSTYTEFLEDAN